MTGLLDIPRELFLAVCAYLEQPELLHLSTVSRFAYVATQLSLYERVTVSTYPGLIKLTRTLGEPPVVTAPDQRYQSVHHRQNGDSGVRSLEPQLTLYCQIASRL